MRPNTLVLKALNEGVKIAVSEASLEHGLEIPIKFQGRNFNAQEKPLYLETVHIPNNRNNDFWNNTTVFQGLYRLVLHIPNEDKGVYGYSDILDTVAGWFSKDKTLREGSMSVKIYKTPDFQGFSEIGAKLQGIATLSYRGQNET